MFRLLMTGTVLLVFGAIAIRQSGDDDATKLREQHSRRWNHFLEASGVGTTNEDLAKKMHGKCVFSGWIPYGGTGTVEHVYVLDDATEMTVIVDMKDEIIAPPRIRNRRQWLRFPDGTMANVEPK